LIAPRKAASFLQEIQFCGVIAAFPAERGDCKKCENSRVRADAIVRHSSHLKKYISIFPQLSIF
jgi:hypothetical protein